MARALLIGCGCHARDAGQRLIERGWSVRGTTRRPAGVAAIEAAGIEAVEADPDRVGSIVELVGDVTVLCWLLGSAGGEPARVTALYRERLPSLLAAIVDTPVRGLVYETGGSVSPALREGGGRRVRAAGERSRIPVAVLDGERSGSWAVSAADAVERAAGLR